MEGFRISEINDEIFSRIAGKSFKVNCTVPPSELRYIELLHKDLSGKILRGEMICNERIADDLLDIFQKLFAANYPIEKVHLIDEYDADSVNFDDYGNFTVKMAVIKASLNRMYAYDVRITPAEKVYEILATQNLSYDTRAVLDSNYTPRPPQRYSDRSEMGQMVSLILNDN